MICRFRMAGKDSRMRERFTEKNVHAVFELRGAGFGTSKIKSFTGLSESSIQLLERAVKALAAGDYQQALREIGADKSQKLTSYAVDKIGWFCDGAKIPRASYEALSEAWKTLVGEETASHSEETENTCDMPSYIKARTEVDTAVLSTLEEICDLINAKPILDVLNYINKRIGIFYLV